MSMILLDWFVMAGRLIYWLYAALIVVMIVAVIMNNRAPLKTMTWVLVLIFLPVVGVFFYFIFGRDYRKKRLIGKRSLSMLSRKSLACYESQPRVQWPPEYGTLVQFFMNVNLVPPFAGNGVEIFTDGLSMLQALLREIGRAKSHIHIQFYIFMNDATGRLVRDALKEKADQGVEVRFLYDSVGCWSVPSAFYDDMRSAGIDARAFFKVHLPVFTSKVNYRNHRKLVVIDGTVGFVGGMNIADRYMKGVPWGCWRDTQMLIRGTAVYGLQTSFLADWYFTDGSLITARKYYPAVTVGEGALMQIVTSQPIGPWRDIMQGLAMAFNRSQKYLYIQTPYFLPNDEILTSLQNVALSGVDVRLMVPQRSDSMFTRLATFSYLGDVLKAGIKVYLYKKGFLHSKMMVSDDLFSTIGSTNVDFRSLEQNFEVNAFIYDRETALKVKSLFLKDQSDSFLLTLKMYNRRRWWQKVKESFVRIFSPIM